MFLVDVIPVTEAVTVSVALPEAGAVYVTVATPLELVVAEDELKVPAAPLSRLNFTVYTVTDSCPTGIATLVTSAPSGVKRKVPPFVAVNAYVAPAALPFASAEVTGTGLPVASTFVSVKATGVLAATVNGVRLYILDADVLR